MTNNKKCNLWEKYQQRNRPQNDIDVRTGQKKKGLLYSQCEQGFKGKHEHSDVRHEILLKETYRPRDKKYNIWNEK